MPSCVQTEVAKLLGAWPSLMKANQTYQFDQAWKYALKTAAAEDAKLLASNGKSHDSIASSVASGGYLPSAQVLFGKQATARQFLDRLAAEEKLRYFPSAE